MLTFINSKLPDDWQISDKQSNTTFSKKVNPIKYPIQTYILVRIWNLFGKTSNLIKVIFNNNICSGIKIQQAKKPICYSVPRSRFFQNSSVLFHQVTFDYSLSYVILIDKPNESYKNSKTFERNTLSTKKSFKKEKKILHQQRQMPQFQKLLQNA